MYEYCFIICKFVQAELADGLSADEQFVKEYRRIKALKDAQCELKILLGLVQVLQLAGPTFQLEMPDPSEGWAASMIHRARSVKCPCSIDLTRHL